MSKRGRRFRRRFIIPEVVQTSGMDCGPASLKALLEGFHISASYGRLREACQTDVDGTSIDTIEEVGGQLGLKAEQVMIPLDHLLLPEAAALPAVVVVRLPNGFTHFVVLWRNHYDRVLQVMDPATGRRWPTPRHFLERVYVHTFPVLATDWRRWAGSEAFIRPLRRRLMNLKMAETAVDSLVEAALKDEGWRSLAQLDAAIRMTAALVEAKGIGVGRQAEQALYSCLRQRAKPIPAFYWSVRPVESEVSDDDPALQLNLRGAVLVRIQGVKGSTAVGDGGTAVGDGGTVVGGEEVPQPLSPELVAALSEPSPEPLRELWQMVKAGGVLSPVVLVPAMMLAGFGIALEALLFRGLIDIGAQFSQAGQRLGVMLTLIVFILGLVLIRFQAADRALRLGKQLEIRTRVAFFRKVPRLRDQYFHSRPISDMAQRSHNIHKMHELPLIGIVAMRHAFTLLFTTIGVIWLSPANGILALLAGMVAFALPLLLLPYLSERDMRMQAHMGALTGFFLDGLLGLVPIRAHGAERSVRREHESLLVAWGQAHIDLFRAVVLSDGAQLVLGYAFAIAILYNHIRVEGSSTTILLLTYWVLSLPSFGHQLSVVIRRYPHFRNTTLRLLEPLRAPEDEIVDGVERPVATTVGTAIRMEKVGVVAAGNEILSGIDVTITPGSHVAVVGPSGAGKSSLVGLLLGWHRVANGRLWVDDVPLSATKLMALRQETAWVDPAVQLWNRSFLDNIRYGSVVDGDGAMKGTPFAGMEMIIEQADLLMVLRKLPQGLQTPLGEGGGLVSGGEGQRVRLGRAMLRQGVRLVILDEPFRGLDRQQRHELLQRARQLWREATLICITHDVSETKSFERVLVMENGRIVEDGVPTALAEDEESRYRLMLQAEEAVRRGLWSSRIWRKLRLADGELGEM